MNKNMSINEIGIQIAELKSRLEILESKLKFVENDFPKLGDEYFYFTPWGCIKKETLTKDEIRVNVYRTREEAESAYNKMKAYEVLKREAKRLNEGWKANFENIENKYYIYLDAFLNESDRLRIGVVTTLLEHPDRIYYKTREIAAYMIENHKTELETIFGVDND